MNIYYNYNSKPLSLVLRSRFL